MPHVCFSSLRTIQDVVQQVFIFYLQLFHPCDVLWRCLKLQFSVNGTAVILSLYFLSHSIIHATMNLIFSPLIHSKYSYTCHHYVCYLLHLCSSEADSFIQKKNAVIKSIVGKNWISHMRCLSFNGIYELRTLVLSLFAHHVLQSIHFLDIWCFILTVIYNRPQ